MATAYESTEVAVIKSQDGIRRLLRAHGGASLSLISHPPNEGFETLLKLEGKEMRLRVMARSRDMTRDRYNNPRTGIMLTNAKEKEEKRVWRVLYYHLKAMFAAADSGVIDVRDVLLPYVVMHDQKTGETFTIAELLKPRLAALGASGSTGDLAHAILNPARLLQ